eukprot:5489538-Pleurochrysis_carterae.AAC.1
MPSSPLCIDQWLKLRFGDVLLLCVVILSAVKSCMVMSCVTNEVVRADLVPGVLGREGPLDACAA